MDNSELDLKAYYYFLLDSEKLPKSYSGEWEKDKKKFKQKVKREKK